MLTGTRRPVRLSAPATTRPLSRPSVILSTGERDLLGVVFRGESTAESGRCDLAHFLADLDDRAL